MTVTSVAPVITDAGIMAPTYYEIVEYLKEKYKSIYGEDAYLESDSQDGQLIGVLALAISDCNAVCINVYNSFSPKTARKDALARNVAINGIKPLLATYSTVDLLITGKAGTLIGSGVAGDSNGNKWILPKNITIPQSGSLTATARAEDAGAVFAPASSIQSILTPTRGWIGVENSTSSSIGQDAESDMKLRQRQALSVSIQSQSMSDGLRGAILALPDVTRCKTINNRSMGNDGNGIPAKSLCVIVYGGDSQAIAKLIQVKQSMGCDLYGNTSVTVLNAYNEPEQINFYRADVTNISFKLGITTYDTYSADTKTLISQTLADYVNQLDIGDKITQNKLYGCANLNGSELSQTYEVDSILIEADGQFYSTDYILRFGSVAFCDPSTISIEVTSG